MNKITKYLLIIFFLVQNIPAQTKDQVHTLPPAVDCRTCHSCEIPTKSNPCLYDCPREQMITIHHSPEEGPDVITINKFFSKTDLYKPVIFTHKLHAEMSDMAGGCTMCHHYNPPGSVLGCNSCHEQTRMREDISKPDLKGAFHQQCMNCHRAWSHSVECESCHALTGKEKIEAKHDKITKTSSRVHPAIIEPTKLVYETNSNQGKLVTFFHNEHSRMFNLECSDCHSNESCVRCHDTQKKFAKTEKSFEDHHKFCSVCHDTKNNCDNCHSNKEMAPFNHLNRTGFALKSFHEKLNCNDCHPGKGKLTPVNASCNTCHGEWTPDNFDHKVTGLVLDDTHKEIDCSTCHENPDFSKPTCENCHDSDITVGTRLPDHLLSNSKTSSGPGR
ncbi:MAG: hypothetical protein A2V66_03815 [Ignavibacteria bacterium RBG_13_36_8]|nr:MAG: hypothetical protein A2V66_03815 [Ignavibacteria bacterium RBG_13_36_8]